jgi:CubicO group peptidase (beta-lactamase class C family)
MNRRHFLSAGLSATVAVPVWSSSLLAAMPWSRFNDAVEILTKATETGQIAAGALQVTQRGQTSVRAFGKGISERSMFLLGSISKPVCVTALMTLFDKGEFQLDDRVSRFLPAFAGDGRERVTIRQLLTHVSGLPDQLPQNSALRKAHADLPEFVNHALKTPLLFAPGTQYGYSSMAILLATHVAELITKQDICQLVNQSVFEPLGLKNSAQGLGGFALSDMVPCQTEFAAPEAGAGDPDAKAWDWNSLYWRSLGAPWGGTHMSASNLTAFFAEFLEERGQVVRPETARLMTVNQNDVGLTPRGLGFHTGKSSGSHGCSENTFGHTGSTGTLAWADRASETICVVLTSLPGRAVEPHPRELAGARIAADAK